MKTTKLQKLFSLLANLLILYWESIALPISWQGVGEQMFIFYTENSNIFSTLACGLMAAAQLAALLRGGEVPLWIKTLKYMSTCCLMLTFLTVVFVLAPIYGPGGHYVLLLTGSMLYHHFLNPVVAFLSLVLFERAPRLPRRAVFYALVPTLLYGGTALALNLARMQEGPYPFLKVYEQPVWASCLWAVVLLGGSWGIARLIWRLNTGRKAARA